MSATCALQGTEESAASIRTRLCPKCFLCERQGELLYESLTDRLYGAPGTWNLRRCPGVECGLVWLDPMPVEEDIGKAYLNYHTHGQGSEPVRTQIRRVGRAVKSNYLSFKYGYSCGLRRPFNFVIGLMMYLLPGVRANVNHGACHLSARRGGRLLDIGCGSGELLNGMRRLGWEAEGTDSDPKAVEIARGKSLKVHLCGTPAELQLASGTFDAVVMSHVIEHLSDPLALLRESHRLLNPGGSLWLRLLPWIFTIYLTWSPWHYSGQNYGLFMMFARRAGADPDKAGRRALYGAFVVSYLILFLGFHTDRKSVV